ncbi:MAG: ABC transporter permease [Candidatus Anammoximicrobium sp.]|nr:ABC transporter permease [Candidatus Anammoximicrobium sp.]
MQISPALWIPAAALGAAAGLLVWQGRIPFRYNVRNLVVRWKTTLLTILAFVAVNSLLVVMLAFVNGMYQLTDNSGNPANVVVLSEGATDESFSNLQFTDAGELENHPQVARRHGRPMCSRESYLVVNQPIPDARPGRPERRFLQLRGLDDPGLSAAIHDLQLSDGGSWFSPAGVRQLPGPGAGSPDSPPAIEVVLGEGIARELGRDRSDQALQAARNRERLEVGDVFVLGDRPWLVVGVLQSSGSTFDSEVWAKRAIIGPMFGKETYTSLVLRAQDAAAARELKEYLNLEYKQAAVQALLEEEYFASLSQTNKQFLFGVIFVVFWLAVGGACGLMNTMFAAVSQRKRDLGVLRLLGFARWQILASLLIESLLLGLVGGLLGCALGSLCHGVKASSIVSSGHGVAGKFVVLVMTVDVDTLLLGLLLSAAMGLLGGLLPALVAVCRRPLEALR